MPSKLILGTERPDIEALEQMRKLGGTFAVYQNHAMDSAALGHLCFLKVGTGCTFESAPARYPDGTGVGPGWKYLHVGYVDFQRGDIVPTLPLIPEESAQIAFG